MPVTRPPRRWSARAGGVLVQVLVSTVLAPAQAAAFQASPPAVQVSTDGRWVTGDSPVEIDVDPPPAPGALAVMIGDEDWTAMFEPAGRGLRLRPGGVRLPAGERALVVYAVAADGWQELRRTSLRVLTRGGYERVDVTPTVEGTNKGQVGIGRYPDEAPTPRDTFQDVGASLGVTTTAVKNGWTTTVAGNVVGVSNQAEALRYAERQEEAPRLDLASYKVSTGNGTVTLAVGHVTFGAHRHLFNGFASRGLLASLRLGPRADVSATATAGSALVGWNNPLGIQDGEHRMAGVTLGLELAERPGGLRVEGSLLTATLLPRAAYNQGGLLDVERNTGAGVRVTATDPAQRVRLDGGMARTTFGNPLDPLLSGGASLVAVRDESRTARYVDVSYALVQRPGGSLSAAFRHERVEPLFGSLQSFVRADVLQNTVDANGTLGPVAIQASAAWSNDNLADVPSVLKTFTRAQQVNVALPLASVVRGDGAKGLPAITYALNRTHQYGGALPGNSDFEASHVPDQVSTNQTVGAEWQLATWRAGYRLNRSFQDNRQPGRALADLANLTHNVSLGVSAGVRADLGVELAYEGAENREQSRIDATRRVAVNASLRPTTLSTVTALVSRTTLGNDVDTGAHRSTDISLQATQTIPFRRPSGKPSAQVFVRYARMSLWLLAPDTGRVDERRLWTINTGVTLSVF